MWCIRVGLVVVLGFPSLAWTEEKTQPPATLPPQVCLATAAAKDGSVQMRVTVPRMVPYTVTRQVPSTVQVPTPDGKLANKTTWKSIAETKYKAVMSETVLVVDGKEVRVSRKDGKAVDPQDLPKLLSKQSAVLVFAHGEIDPYYLQVIDDQVLIVVVPASKEFPARSKDRD